MDDPTLKNIVVPAAGTHVVLPGYFGSKAMGLANPKTSDGRIIFFIPWQNAMIAGTTGITPMCICYTVISHSSVDAMVEVSQDPQPTGVEVDWILKELQNQLGHHP